MTRVLEKPEYGADGSVFASPALDEDPDKIYNLNKALEIKAYAAARRRRRSFWIWMRCGGAGKDGFGKAGNGMRKLIFSVGAGVGKGEITLEEIRLPEDEEQSADQERLIPNEISKKSWWN